MKLFVIILTLASVAIASELAFKCTFKIYGEDEWIADDYYGCKHEDETGITEPTVTVTSIVGDHTEGSTNDDVKLLIYKDDTKHLAKGISKFFPNIEYFKAFDVGLEHVSRSDFEGLSKIFILKLSSNKLKEIPDDTFVDLVNLKELSLMENKLKKFPNIKTLSKLAILHLNNNEIKSITAEDLSGNKELTHLDLSNNKLTFIDQNILKALPKLEHGIFLDNPCIDLAAGSEIKDEVVEEFMVKVKESCQHE